MATQKNTEEKPVSKYKQSSNYREGANVYEFTLPSGGPARQRQGGYKAQQRVSKPGEEKKRKVVIMEPSELIMADALKLASAWQNDGNMTYLTMAQGYQLRLCLLTIDGKPVDLEMLEGERLEDHFNEYERSFLIKAIERLTTPPDTEVEDFLQSMRML